MVCGSSLSDIISSRCGLHSESLQAYNRALDEKQSQFLEEFAASKNLSFWSEEDCDWDADEEFDEDEED